MNKKSRSKAISLALAGMLILAACTGIVLGGQVYLESTSFKNWLSQKLSDSLSRPTRLASNLEVSLGLPPQIKLRGLSIANPDWANQREFLQAEQVTLAPRLLPLFTGKLAFAVVASKNANIQIEKNEGGNFSWPSTRSKKNGDNKAKKGFFALSSIDQAEFSNVSVSVQGGYDLQLSLTNLSTKNDSLPGQKPSQVRLEGTLNGQPLSASWGSDNLLWFLNSTANEFTDIKFVLGKNTLNGNLQVDRSVTPVRISGNLQSKHTSFVANDSQPSDRLVPNLPLPTAWLDHIQADIDWNIEKLTLGAITIRQLRATTLLQNAQLKIDPLDAKIGKAGLHLRMAYANSDGRASLRASGELDNLDLSQNIQWLSGNDPGAGYLDLRFVAKGVGKNTRELAAALNGTTQLVMEEGQVSNAWLQRVTSDLGSLINPWSDQDGQTPVRCLAVRLKTKQGKANIEQMVLDTRTALILGEGDINLANEQVDIVLSPDTRSLDLLKLQLPIRISGSLTALDADLAPTAIITRSGTNILGTIANAGGLLRQDLEDSFGSSSAGCKASLVAYRDDSEDGESSAE